MIERERDIERRLRETVEKSGGLCLKWVCPGWSGVPDRIILLPGGRVIFAETKRPQGGRVSKLQEWWLGRLRRMGFMACVVWDRHDVARLEALLHAPK